MVAAQRGSAPCSRAQSVCLVFHTGEEVGVDVSELQQEKQGRHRR